MNLLLVQPPPATHFGVTRVMLSEPLGLERVGAAALSSFTILTPLPGTQLYEARQLRTPALYLEPPGTACGPEPGPSSSTSRTPSAATPPTSR